MNSTANAGKRCAPPRPSCSVKTISLRYAASTTRFRSAKWAISTSHSRASSTCTSPRSSISTMPASNFSASPPPARSLHHRHRRQRRRGKKHVCPRLAGFAGALARPSQSRSHHHRGFLYPNAVLEARGLMKRKGFPESYDQRCSCNS